VIVHENSGSADVQAVADVGGVVSAAVADLLMQGERALQVCVMIDGKTVVDVAGGFAGAATGDSIGPGALFTVFSATKGVLAMTALAFASMGLLDLDEPVADVWPEFAVNGKEEVTPRHLLTHTAGIPHMPPDVSVGQMCDWEAMTAAVANLEPLWRPGTTIAYHAYTFGWALGECIRRCAGDGRVLRDIVRDTVTLPSGARDFWLGVSADDESRVVTLHKAPGQPGRATELAQRAIPPALATSPEIFNRSDVRRACLPAAGGISNARSLASVYGMFASGGAVGGRQVIAESLVDAAARVQCQGVDKVIGPVARGLGMNVSSDVGDPNPFDSARRTAGHPGAGGSIAWADLDTHAGAAITRSNLTADGWRGPAIQRLISVVNSAVAAL
jgi:CubicO group peptidase (beta-lactamase class C family)